MKIRIYPRTAMLLFAILISPLTYTMNKTVEEKNIFDTRTWDGKLQSFTHYRNSADNIVRPINGAGVLPTVKARDGKLYFILSVAVVENGTDENIGSEPVYTNPSNYPILDPNMRSEEEQISFELSTDMAARPEELSCLTQQFTHAVIKKNIEDNGYLLPNAGMWYGRYAVPTYLIYCGYFEGIEELTDKSQQKIAQQEYEKLFPTQSSIQRTDTIVKFELVLASRLLQAIEEHASQRIEKPLPIDGYTYKLSPYVARTIALNNNPGMIAQALQKYETL